MGGLVVLYLFILYIIFCMIYTNLMGAVNATHLYFDRHLICPPCFLDIHKKADLVVALMKYSRFFYSLVIVFSFINTINNSTDNIFLFISTGIFCVVSISIQSYAHMNDMFEKMKDIKNQWSTEKKISSLHDDEVRLYNRFKDIEKGPNLDLFYIIFNIFINYGLTLC